MRSPRGWLRWSVSVLESQSRPFSPRFDHLPRSDFRMRDSRETAISIKMLLERSANGCGGRGPRLLVEYYLSERSWFEYTESEQYLLAKTARRFARGLRAAGFLEDRVTATPGVDRAV